MVEGPTTGPFLGLNPKTETVYAEAHAALTAYQVTSLNLTDTQDINGTTYSSPGGITKAPAAGDRFIGVVQEATAAGDVARVLVQGRTKVQVTNTDTMNAIAIGEFLETLTTATVLNDDSVAGTAVAIAMEAVNASTSDTIDCIFYGTGIPAAKA